MNTITACVITNGEVYAPKPLGVQSVLIIGKNIIQVGKIDIEALKRLELDLDLIDASGCLLMPGIIDPHQHYLGGSGEHGFATQTPEITLQENIEGGITTSVGCLGADSFTRTMHGLLGRARVFNEEGLTSFIYTGGYQVPPSTLTGSVKSDMILIPEVIGAGEVAIADIRGSHPSTRELARISNEAYVGGILTRKAGITHLHVGPGKERLSLLRKVIADYEVSAHCFHPTHMTRSESLMREGIEFTREGGTIDMDVEDQDLLKWMTFYCAHGGKKDWLTISSDASIVSPATLFEQVRDCVLSGHFAIEEMLPMITSNPARILRLPKKGKIEKGADADVLIIEKSNFKIREVISHGRILMRESRLAIKPLSMNRGNRKSKYHD